MLALNPTCGRRFEKLLQPLPYLTRAGRLSTEFTELEKSSRAKFLERKEPIQPIHLHKATYYHPGTVPKVRLLELGLILVALILFVTTLLPAISRSAGYVTFLPDAIPVASALEIGQPNNNLGAGVVPGTSLTAFEQSARELASAGSSDAFARLVQDLNQSESVSHRAVVLQVLKEAPPEINPVLIDALNDPDVGVRAGAAQALGLRQDTLAISGLDIATRDSHAWVRSEAAQSLGEIQAWQELPRLNQLQVSDPNPIVYASARGSVSAIRARLAAEIGLLADQLVDVSVTPSEQPRVYLLTADNLYVRNGTDWENMGPVPDNPIALATGTDVNTIYLTTVHMGLYHSLDGGVTWQHLQFGSNTPRPVIVTAIAASPELDGRLYAALAVPGSRLGELTPLDLVTSSDGGNSWVSLPDPPLQFVTTHLYTDPQSPGYLFGLGDDTAWRYPLY